MFAGSAKSGPELANSEPDFDYLWRLLVRQKSEPEWRNSGPSFFSETYFWARFVTILWGLLLL